MLFDKEMRSEFWATVENDYVGLAAACGCYVFAIRSGGGTTPWYVGLAERQTFKEECFTEDKRKKYDSALLFGQKGTPVLYFYARITEQKGYFSKPSTRGYRDIPFLEKMLIGLALGRNPNLINKQETTLLKSMEVPGLLNTKPGALRTAAKELQSVLGY